MTTHLFDPRPGIRGSRCWPLLCSALAAGALLHAADTTTTHTGWSVIQVPGAWETNGPASAHSYDGVAWFRTWLKPHDSFFTPHERNLFAESVTFNVRDLADAHEVFINGQSIGGGGSFPPRFESGRAGNHRHKVPPGLLRKGQWNEILLRVYNHAGPGGFLGEAPFIMDYFQECVLQGPWEFRLGTARPESGTALTNRPATSGFDQYHESHRVLGEAAQFVHGPKLAPPEALAALRAHPEFTVEQLLHDPTVAQPVHLSFDERGRLWVAQYRQYPYPAGVRMLSRDKYYRSHYDAVPPAPPHHHPGRDVISVHEDTDGDGRYDRHKVFLEGLNMANAALRGRGGVWVMHTPYLLFYPDADFDDVPDGPPVVHLAGFGLEDTHSIANGLVWGMDGWLYGAQGSTTSSRVTRPGIDPPGTPGVGFEGCMVWRYHPETRAYEIFAEGTGNIFGLEIDAEGQLFSGHNGANTRGWHYVQGGFYLKQDVDPGKFGPPRYPYAFGELPMLRTTNAVPRFSHFFAVGEGTALPSGFADKLFALDPVHSSILACERRGRGATYETIDLGAVLSSSDPGFRPVHIVNAPDGSLCVADLYEHYIAHGQHYQSQIDPTSGRIYRLRGKDARLEHDLGLAEKTASQLVELLSHPNKWHRHTAVRLLGERRDPSSRQPLAGLLHRDAGRASLAALWALHQAGWYDDAIARSSFTNPQPAVRQWAVRLAGDTWGRHPGLGSPPDPAKPAPAVPAALATALNTLSRQEPHPQVRAQLAASARRWPAAVALPVLVQLLLRTNDVADPYIPLLCWWGLEHHLAADRDRVLSLFQAPNLWDAPIVLEQILPRIMRRLAADGRQDELRACVQLLHSAPSPPAATQLLKGFEEAYRGRPLTGLPDDLLSALARAGGAASLALRIRQADPAAVQQALELARDSRAQAEERLLAIATLGELRITDALPVLLDLACQEGPLAIRRSAFAALANFNNDRIATRTLAVASALPSELRGAAGTLLLTRPSWTQGLLQALADKTLPLAWISPEVADRLRTLPDPSLRALAETLFPKPDVTPDQLARRLAQVETALRGGPGNPYAGEPLFQQRCAACHKLFFKGGQIGPDLTHYQRDNLGTMLLSIVNPNAEIREGFQSVEIETHDGRTLTGFVTDRTAQIVVLRGLDGLETPLPQADVKTLQPAGRSLMPEGLLDDLTDPQLRDLFAFLRSSQPFSR